MSGIRAYTVVSGRLHPDCSHYLVETIHCTTLDPFVATREKAKLVNLHEHVWVEYNPFLKGDALNDKQSV